MLLVQDFVNNWLNFYMDINKKKGINEINLDKLENSLILLKNEYANKDYIPKEIGNIFIDLYSSLESLSDLYSDNEKKEIIEIADYLATLARDVCS